MRPLFYSLLLALACVLIAPPAAQAYNPSRYHTYSSPVVPYAAPRGVYVYPQISTTPNYWHHRYYGYPYGYGSFYSPGYWGYPYSAYSPYWGDYYYGGSSFYWYQW